MKALFKSNLTIEEVATLLNKGNQNAKKKDDDRSTNKSSFTIDEDGNLKE